MRASKGNYEEVVTTMIVAVRVTHNAYFFCATQLWLASASGTTRVLGQSIGKFRVQTVLGDAAAAVGEMALQGKALERAVERIGADPGGGPHVLREVVAEPVAGHEDRLETAAASDRSERLGHRPDVRVDGKMGPVAGEAAAG